MNLWIEDRVFYNIFTLGFCDVLEPSRIYEEKNRLIKIEEWIPHLKKMSINAIYFGPVFESSYHGYDTRDYLNIDKRLGTNEDFKDLCKKLHENDIKIVLDGVFNHVGREFWAFKDIQKNGRNSKYCNWFSGLNFDSRSPMGDDFNYESWNGCYDLVKLNLWNRDVVEYLLHAVEFWIDEFDIDGLRLDAADKIIFDFFKELKIFTEKKKDNFWLMGEIIHGDYNRWANKDSLDSVTNYECYKGIYSSHNDKNYFEIAYSLNRMFGDGGIYKDLCLYNFVDNHDVNRLASTLKVQEYLFNVYTILYTMPGVPSIYYGSEYGIKAVKGDKTDLPLRPSVDEIENYEDKNNELFDHIEKLGRIRVVSEALKNGNYEQVIIKNEQYVFSRTSKNDKIYIVLNLSDKESYLDFNISFEEGKDLLSDKDDIIKGGDVSIRVPAFSSKVIAKIK
ncbi:MULTISPECIES: alpha-amylase family glycosyl hydrolase [Clostridium]|uniref:Alpha-amylase n=1 Tax=Clostridium butyricum TaxID=1492 RepID=A0AAP9RGQ5_CLOBU|nr:MULTISPECIES: alpha-amylase family glycosyl hydrolase [Clostridium]MBS4842522.1 alpha-amylase [Clostridium sp.]MBZ5747069.1 alpha-amylase [Clostridium butyricum]MDU1402874.1 alpha-amylase family glycosyl hydrolase [Clostridium sp.]MDU1603658.1 alpha-amylase family glycosyl hydrolase [Clostridium sp.]MDU2895589.1 alpha-amylase family glycosyl hydrolase [Clostridium sp.]